MLSHTQISIPQTCLFNLHSWLSLLHYNYRQPHTYKKVSVCILTSASCRMLWNGKESDMIISIRELRQGDPLSSYLFVLCMKRPSQWIETRAKMSAWRAVKASRGGPRVSHLLFADDILLFAEASKTILILLRRAMGSARSEIHLRTPAQGFWGWAAGPPAGPTHVSLAGVLRWIPLFCKASGQMVNFSKSSVYFSHNITMQETKRLGDRLRMSITTNLGKHLGFQLLHKGTNKKAQSDILQ